MNKQPNKKKKITKIKKPSIIENSISKKKLRNMLIVIITLFVLLTSRLFFLQVVDGERLTNLAVTQQTTSEIISSKRGNIYDSTGVVLAKSETVDTISINPNKLVKKKAEDTKSYKELVARGLSDVFKLDYNETLNKVNSTASVETIAKKVEEDKVNELKTWMKENKIGVGINIDEDTKRYYPNKTIASQVIGVCGADNQGLSGIEYSYDSILKGVSGQITTSTDAANGEIPNSVESFVEAKDGYNLNLTIDVKIQSIVEKYLKQAAEDNKCSRGGNCIIMDPSNGHILAMASYPNYDLNEPYTPTSYYADDWDKLSKEEKSKRIYSMWKVRSVSEMYEPGSVFKLITASTALEENITTTNKKGDFYCNGKQHVADKDIACWSSHPHGSQTLTNALENSCNPALMQLGKRIGARTLYKYYDAFGFFDKTNVGLSGEEKGAFHDLENVGPVELATMSFGQRFTITPLQMTTALCSVVNGGYLIEPTLVKSMSNPDTGEIIDTKTKVVRQVISSQTSSQMREMMQSVVINGTGKKAAVKGYSVGGKSGTSEPPVGNKKAGYVASFAAISPVENTKLVVLVTLYDPHGSSHQGGTVAGPVAGQILSEVLPYLGIQPDQN